ncbi:proteoglycan Cow-like [Pomacea canaliculata]|uniref:proteoglycan Cow-like n=1 Tax=Pomacea canaliculata TaxID=400727 RepID=UPI000D73318E|nr:proteoglycan Cow-like [Pomacea canaliculata]
MKILIKIIALLMVSFVWRTEARRSHQRHYSFHGEKHNGDDNLGINRPNPSTSRTNDQVHKRKIGWIEVKEVPGCECKGGEICIQGPKHHRPVCIKEHQLKESARLFRRFHERKELAEERKNDIDHKHRSSFEAPHDLHISVFAKHKQSHEGKNRPSVSESMHYGKRLHLNNMPFNKTEDMPVADAPSSGTKCDSSALDQMRQRLTGWFHVLRGKNAHHSGKKHQHKKHHHFSVKKELRDKHPDGKCSCLRSVMWEFRQIDIDHNHNLNKTELVIVDSNDKEPCLHPYLWSCDKNSDGLLSRSEWCCCFQENGEESPCFKKLKEIESLKNEVSYVPSCDQEGYFEKQQCMGSEQETQVCWCVTPNGSQIPGSRTYGHAHCGKLDVMGYPKSWHAV